jgi:hypothetical protein
MAIEDPAWLIEMRSCHGKPMKNGTYMIYTDLGDGITTVTPYGFTVDVSPIVRRWEAYERRLLKAYFEKKGIRARRK